MLKILISCLSPLLLLLSMPVCSIETSIDLNDENWKLMLEDEWMVQFLAPWCESCKTFAPIWQGFEKVAKKMNINTGTIDITKSPSLSGRFFVTNLPAIYHSIDGDFRVYKGPREIDALINYIKAEEWNEECPVKPWFHPNTLQMDVMAWFFHLSMIVKDWNERLQKEYDLSVYQSNGIFVLVSMLIGAMNGILLILLLDWVCPPKRRNRRDFVNIKKDDENGKNIKITDDIDELTVEQVDNGVKEAEDTNGELYSSVEQDNDDEFDVETFADADRTYYLTEEEYGVEADDDVDDHRGDGYCSYFSDGDITMNNGASKSFQRRTL